jgi:hypothetical protein
LLAFTRLVCFVHFPLLLVIFVPSSSRSQFPSGWVRLAQARRFSPMEQHRAHSKTFFGDFFLELGAQSVPTVSVFTPDLRGMFGRLSGFSASMNLLLSRLAFAWPSVLMPLAH